MPWWNKGNKTVADALLEATQDWKPYSGTAYDTLKNKAERFCTRAQKQAQPPRWFELWRWLSTPCNQVDCRNHDVESMPMTVTLQIMLICAVLMFTATSGTSLVAIACPLVILAGTMNFLVNKRRWNFHHEHLEAMRSHSGYLTLFMRYMRSEAAGAKNAVIGDQAPLRIAQKKLASRLEEVQALAVRIEANTAAEKDERLLRVLRPGLKEARELEAFITRVKTKVDDRIAGIKAFFDECDSRITCLEAPIRIMTLRAELDLHRQAADEEALEAEAAMTQALVDLQTRWIALQQTANTYVPRAVAKAFAVTADNDEKQNLETLEAAMDKVFDTLPPPPKAVGIN